MSESERVGRVRMGLLVEGEMVVRISVDIVETLGDSRECREGWRCAVDEGKLLDVIGCGKTVRKSR